VLEPDSRQLALGEWKLSDSETTETTVSEHQRRTRPARPEKDETDLRFDESVPVEEIVLLPEGVDADAEVISTKVTMRLAQRPSSFVVLKYIRPVLKTKDGSLACAPAPAGVLGKSIADVSLLACMAIDKFSYYLPLYRQHQRMKAAGIRLARSTLTQLIHRTANLLKPIYEAQLQSILESKVLAMDETPIKAGRKKDRGGMKTGYFWPIYGDKDEVAFPFSPSRSGEALRQILKQYVGVLLSDGYAAYEAHAKRVNGIVHAQCWAHTRRQLLKAEGVEPKLTARALELIRRLYDEEGALGRRPLDDAKRVELRARQCKPIVDEFFEWLKTTLDERALLPSNPFTEAAGYALAREGPLRVFLEYPGVPIDTNHLEREIRPIAVGRKNWLFCWTEVGAECVGIFQGLLATCRLQGVDPYTYLVDVLQRVEDHPASDVAALTPRLWKERFAEDPRRSVIDRDVKNADS
jgi:transposase